MLRAHVWLWMLVGTFVLRVISIALGLSDRSDLGSDVSYLMGAAAALGIHWALARPNTQTEQERP